MRVHALRLGQVEGEVASLRPTEERRREVVETVQRILADVRAGGDDALAAATARLDWPGAVPSALAVPEEEVRDARRLADDAFVEAISLSVANVRWFHSHEIPEDWEEEGPQGQRLGVRHRPVHRAGLYVPGGDGSYASTVVMSAVPARVAGVDELFICTPPDRQGCVNASVLLAASELGITEIYRVGGAQAVAAMAYGTGTIPRADVVCGPGNEYVTEAKRQVYGQVGIDGLAGPSEVIVVADSTCRPDWIAADLLAQAEHGSGAEAVLIAESAHLCSRVGRALEDLVRGGPVVPADRIHAFHPDEGADFLALASSFVNAYGPEHLELHIADPQDFLDSVEAAGAIFLGGRSPTAFGDYIVGSNHVLPTGGAARFGSPLSVHTFLRRTALVGLDEPSAKRLVRHLAVLADREGFHYHRLSAEIREDPAG